MAEKTYDDTNRGVLFKQTDKASDKAPDFSGKFNFDGKEVELVGWAGVSSNGCKYIQLRKAKPQEGGG